MTTVVISPTGMQGPAGNTIRSGEGAPGSTVGVDGDYYVDLTDYPTSAVFYGPKAGSWPGSGITIGGGGSSAVISVNGQTGAVEITAAGIGALLAASNLSDLPNAATARTNLGLGSAATQAASAFDAAGAASTAQTNAESYTTTQIAAEVTRANAAYDAAGAAAAAQTAAETYTSGQISSEVTRANAAYLAKASNLGDVASAPTARTNLGLGSAATQSSSAFDASGAAATAQSNAEAFTTSSISALDLGGASQLNVGTGAGTVAAGNDARIVGALQGSNNLSDVANAGTARTNLGLGAAATAGAATGSAEGILQLASDLGGTATAPTVVSTHLAAPLPIAQGGTASTARVWAGLLTPTGIKTAAYTAAPGDFIPVDTTSASVVVTLPTAPADLTTISGKMINTTSGHTVTINTGGADTFNRVGGGTSLTLTLLSQGVTLQYNAALAVWYIYGDDLPLGQLDTRYVQTTGLPLPIASGGTGQATQQAAINALAGATTSGAFLRGNGTNAAMAAIQASDLPAATSGAQGAVQLAGDIAGGTGAAPQVTGTHLASALPVAQGGTGAASLSAAGILQAGNNLSDLGSASTARTNLGLGAAATAGAATSGAEGIIQLAGDIGGGTASAPQVTGTHLAAALPVAQGGTGQASTGAAYNALAPTTTLGDIAYANGSGTNARLAGSTSATKQYLQQTGNGTISAAPAWGTIQAGDVPTLNQSTTGTAANITGTAAIANGGTGQTSAGPAFNALSPVTSTGDLIYGSGTNTNSRLAGNTSATKNFLVQTGNGSVSAAPAWGTIAAGDLPAATTSAEGVVQLAGDLGGTGASPSVLKINGVVVNGTPAANQVVQASNSTTAAWASLTPGGIGALAKSSNLNDVASASTARTNLGLTSVATASVGLITDMVAAGASAAGATGRWADAGHAHPSTDRTVGASGLISWAFPPSGISSAGAGVSGTIYYMMVVVPAATTITNIELWQVSAGSTLTSSECFVGLYSSAGTQVAVSADQSTAWASGSNTEKTVALTSTYSAAAGNYWVALLFNGTTGPSWPKGPPTGMLNAGWKNGSPYPAMVSGSGNTALPGSVTFSGLSNVTSAFWAGIS